jgi:hypothetical protein
MIVCLRVPDCQSSTTQEIRSQGQAEAKFIVRRWILLANACGAMVSLSQDIRSRSTLPTYQRDFEYGRFAQD